MWLNRLLMNPEVRAAKVGDDEALLRAHQQVWKRKHILRYYYETWYKLIDEALLPGTIVEIASGIGNFSSRADRRKIIATDILCGQNVAVVTDAHYLPFSTGSISNFVMIDALHHMAKPMQVLARAAECLKPGGRFVMLESYMSPWASLVFKFHHEKSDYSYDIYNPLNHMPQIWYGNAAMSRLVFDRPERLPLIVESIKYLEFLSYPLCGGFTYRSLLPAPLLRSLHKLEVSPLFANRFLGLRMLAIMTKL